MRATLMYGAGDVRVEDVPDPVLQQPTDALVRIATACICGSDLHPYARCRRADGPARWATSSSASSRRPVPTCHRQARRPRHRAVRLVRRHLRVLPRGPADLLPPRRLLGRAIGGGQAEAVRVPLADGTLVKPPVGEDSALLPSLLTLSDVFGTGHHAAVSGGVTARTTVTVIGDGAVGLLRRARGQAARRRADHPDGPPQGPHRPRPRVRRHRRRRRARRGGHRRRSASSPAATAPTRCSRASATCPPTSRRTASSGPAASISRVGVPQYEEAPGRLRQPLRPQHHPHRRTGPARAYIEELLPDVLEGRIEPGKVFDRTVDLDGVPDGYRAMDDREALKVIVQP